MISIAKCPVNTPRGMSSSGPLHCARYYKRLTDAFLYFGFNSRWKDGETVPQAPHSRASSWDPNADIKELGKMVEENRTFPSPGLPLARKWASAPGFLASRNGKSYRTSLADSITPNDTKEKVATSGAVGCHSSCSVK